tara:strand:- start:248 stop:580 length:333 start_codon:yes stop_codon:yes gene_type:complete
MDDRKREANKRWQLNNRDKFLQSVLNSTMKRRYGIDLKEYDKLSSLQNDVCYICNNKCNTKNTKRLSIDHCHKTGKIRKLLCKKCNTALGQVNDNIDLLNKMIKYIKDHK